MDRIVKKAKSHNAADVMDYMNYRFMDPGYAVDGFITRYKGSKYYGVSDSLTGKKREFAIYHEGFHGICGHLDIPGFLSSNGFHTEDGNFADYKLVADTERDANIGAADQVIDTRSILDMLGYDNKDVAGYCKSVQSFEQAMADYKSHFSTVLTNGSDEKRIRRMRAYQEELSRMYEELQEQAQDISNAGVCLSRDQIAGEFGVPEFIIDYKMRALEIRHYDIPEVELLSFGSVFTDWD